jgi:hypothetical protein
MWVFLFTSVFVLLIIGSLFNFFKVFLTFLNAKGCFAVILLLFIGLPSVLVLLMLGGYKYTSIILVILSILGVLTGYIARDSEGNVGTFGYFLLILSIITLVITLITSRMFGMI